jgi:hypothetical protein
LVESDGDSRVVKTELLGGPSRDRRREDFLDVVGEDDLKCLDGDDDARVRVGVLDAAGDPLKAGVQPLALAGGEWVGRASKAVLDSGGVDPDSVADRLAGAGRFVGVGDLGGDAGEETEPAGLNSVSVVLMAVQGPNRTRESRCSVPVDERRAAAPE